MTMKYAPNTPESLLVEQYDDHPDGVVNAAIEHAEDHPERNSGKAPSGIAAACLYLAYRERPTQPTFRQDDAAETFGTTDVTLRERLREMGVTDL